VIELNDGQMSGLDNDPVRNTSRLRRCSTADKLAAVRWIAMSFSGKVVWITRSVSGRRSRSSSPASGAVALARRPDDCARGKRASTEVMIVPLDGEE
jgi:hypothetical protein